MIVTVLFLVIGKLRDQTSVLIFRSDDSLIEEFRTVLEQKCSEVLTSIDKVEPTGKTLDEWCHMFWNENRQLTSNAATFIRYSELRDKLKDVFTDLQLLSNSMLETANAFVSKTSALFANGAENLARLETMSNDIRTRAITPSFELLNNFHKQLKEVDEQL